MTHGFVLPHPADLAHEPFADRIWIALKDLSGCRVHVERPVYGRLEEPFLGTEVVHDERGIHARLLGDRPDGRLLVAEIRESLPGRLEYLRPGAGTSGTAARVGTIFALTAFALYHDVPSRARVLSKAGFIRARTTATPPSTTNEPATQSAKAPSDQPRPAPSK